MESLDEIDGWEFLNPKKYVRNCETCNTPLTDDNGKAIRKFHLTYSGFVCDRHQNRHKPYSTYHFGDIVIYKPWF